MQFFPRWKLQRRYYQDEHYSWFAMRRKWLFFWKPMYEADNEIDCRKYIIKHKIISREDKRY